MCVTVNWVFLSFIFFEKYQLCGQKYHDNVLLKSVYIFGFKICSIQTLNCLHNKLLFVYLFYSSKSNSRRSQSQGTHSNCTITFFSSSLLFYVKHKQFCLPASLLGLHYTAYRFIMNCCCCVQDASENDSTAAVRIIIDIDRHYRHHDHDFIIIDSSSWDGRTRTLLCILCSF